MTSFDAALALRPDDANLRFDASLCRLLLGHMAAGWRDFEARWDHRLMRDQRRNFPQPRWQGETSGTVLLHAEQAARRETRRELRSGATAVSNPTQSS